MDVIIKPCTKCLFKYYFSKNYFMSFDVNNLLSLPMADRKRIAEKLWSSLDPVNSLSREEEKNIKLLEKRWNNFISGKTKVYAGAEFREAIKEFRKGK